MSKNKIWFITLESLQTLKLEQFTSFFPYKSIFDSQNSIDRFRNVDKLQNRKLVMLINKQKLAKNIILNHIKRNLHIKMEKQPIQVHSPQKQNQNTQVQSPTVFNNIIAYLTERKTPFELIEHESASTSAESAQIRNTPLEWGSKTMLVREKNSQIVMLLYRANSKVSWNKVRKIDYVGKKSKMLTKQQLYSEFGLYPGAVPPFANILKIKGIIDSKFGSHQKMAFNAGLKSKSIVMDYKDFPLQTFEQVDITEDEAKKE